MSDDVFRQTRRKINPEDLANQGAYAEEGNDPLAHVRNLQSAMAQEVGDDEAPMPHTMPGQNPDKPFAIQGQMPEGLRRALEQRGSANDGASHQSPQSYPEDDNDNDIQKNRNKMRPVPETRQSIGSEELESLLQKLAATHSSYEPIELPSKGKFYNGIPGTLSIRPMTGEEEQILATPRHVRKGKAIDMIFERCVQEPIDTTQLLSVDRTYMLIFLRGISYTPEYDVEIKCPECTMKFNHVIDLNDMDVDGCPVDFGPTNLTGKLPTTGFRYRYRLATGDDEQAVTRYREARISNFEKTEDDTLLYRTAILLESIEGVTDRNELNLLLKKLPINDVAYIRGVINDPPFGVNTDVNISCPNCQHEFKIDLPLEANFFFPRKKTGRTQA